MLDSGTYSRMIYGMDNQYLVIAVRALYYMYENTTPQEYAHIMIDVLPVPLDTAVFCSYLGYVRHKRAIFD